MTRSCCHYLPNRSQCWPKRSQHLALQHAHKLRVVWIGNDHTKTYGGDIWSKLCDRPNVSIYDTRVHGRPNVAQLAADALREFRAQAVFCVSNRALTQVVVQACLAHAIPAYGATWDS